MYNVYLSTRGVEELVFRGPLEEASKYEDDLRKACRASDPDGAELDCYMQSDEDIQKEADAISFWDTLTEEDKKDIIVVEGREYIRKVYEHNHS